MISIMVVVMVKHKTTLLKFSHAFFGCELCFSGVADVLYCIVGFICVLYVVCLFNCSIT